MLFLMSPHSLLPNPFKNFPCLFLLESAKWMFILYNPNDLIRTTLYFLFCFYWINLSILAKILVYQAQVIFITYNPLFGIRNDKHAIKQVAEFLLEKREDTDGA